MTAPRPGGGPAADRRPSPPVEGPLRGQGAAAERILRALPGWFGIESSLLDYVAAAEQLPTFVVRTSGARPGEAGESDVVQVPGGGGAAPPTGESAAAPERGDVARAPARDDVAGFLTLRPTSARAVEVHVLAVLPQLHRRGIGRALVERAAAHARAEGFTLLHVKTLAPSDPDPGYAATRRFYEALGFVPLEELPQVWGPENPCLILVRPL